MLMGKVPLSFRVPLPKHLGGELLIEELATPSASFQQPQTTRFLISYRLSSEHHWTPQDGYDTLSDAIAALTVGNIGIDNWDRLRTVTRTMLVERAHREGAKEEGPDRVRV